MKDTPAFKFSIIFVKALVFFTSVYYIFLVIKKNFSALQTTSFNWLTAIQIVASIALYMVLIMVLVLAWQFLLSKKMPAISAQIYFKSQVLKYLPGNVFHFAYRHTETKKIGFSHKQLIRASLYESMGLMVAAILVTSTLFLWPHQIPLVSQWITVPFWAVLLIQLLGLAVVIKWTQFNQLYNLLTCYLCYFFGMGLIAYGITTVFEFQPQPYLFITACFALSWLAGYAIPGAPGGLGVREATFILLTSPQVNETEALVLIALIRLISIAAEILIYFFSATLSRPYRHLEAWSDKTAL